MVPDADPADADSPHTIKAAAEAPGAEATGVEAAEAAGVEAARVEAAEAEAIDEERRRAVAAGQITFEHIHVEGQPVALELRRLQHHDGIADFRPVRAEHRDGGVRRILGKALIAGHCLATIPAAGRS